MPTFVTHAVLGIAASTVFSNMVDSRSFPRFCALSAVCSALPDADTIGFAFDVPYGHFFGHRGFFHSIAFAVLLAVLVTCVFFREERTLSRKWWLIFGYFALLTASHGILDYFTRGGLGIALFSPFDTSRYQSHWAPFEAAPLDISGMFTDWGIRVVKKEFFWLWVPAFVIILLTCCKDWFRAVRRQGDARFGSRSEDPPEPRACGNEGAVHRDKGDSAAPRWGGRGVERGSSCPLASGEEPPQNG